MSISCCLQSKLLYLAIKNVQEQVLFSFNLFFDQLTHLFRWCSLSWAAAGEERVRYDNYQMYRIVVQTEEQYKSLKELEKPLNLMFWDEAHGYGDTVDIMVPPEKAVQFRRFLNRNALEYDLAIKNVQELIDAEKPEGRSKLTEASYNWTDYPTYDEINAFIDLQARKHPLTVKLFSIGQSYEGREIRGLKISYKKGNKAIFIDANIHAIERISSSVVTYILDQLLNSWDPLTRIIAESFDWYIIPIVNPDGFVYTHDVNRLWRKNRKPNSVCVGTDLNRNFDFQWMAAGASADPCDHMYAGPYPNSEPEVINLSNFILNIPDDYIKIYLAFHSYGQYVLTPWGHTTDPPPTYDTLLEVGHGFTKAAAIRYGTNYTAGSSATTLYKVSGAAKDWNYGVKGVPISCTIELRDQGQTGFFLPPNWTDSSVASGISHISKLH